MGGQRKLVCVQGVHFIIHISYGGHTHGLAYWPSLPPSRQLYRPSRRRLTVRRFGRPKRPSWPCCRDPRSSPSRPRPRPHRRHAGRRRSIALFWRENPYDLNIYLVTTRASGSRMKYCNETLPNRRDIDHPKSFIFPNLAA